jgi:hypothetical protein
MQTGRAPECSGFLGVPYQFGILTFVTKDIIGKLRDHLSQPVNTECTVMYLLAGIRKIPDYARIVEDGAISCKHDKQDELQAVSKVVFSKSGQPIAADSLLSLVVRWDIHLKDRRICRMGFEAKANKQMLFWGLQLIPAPVSPQAPQRL